MSTAESLPIESDDVSEEKPQLVIVSDTDIELMTFYGNTIEQDHYSNPAFQRVYEKGDRNQK